MNSIIINTAAQLRQFKKDSQHFYNILFCDCDGESLGRQPDSLTSVQIYDPKSQNGYYIDVQELRNVCKQDLINVLKPFFEDKDCTFVFYDPTNDYIGIEELGIKILRIFDMRIACPSKSLQNLMETRGDFLAWEIYEWLLEKYESRKKFAKSDYSDITNRPLSDSHVQMAIKDAYYLHLVFEKEKLIEKVVITVKKTMDGLPKLITEKKKMIYSEALGGKFQIFAKTNLIGALRHYKLRWLACGYIGSTLSNRKFINANEKKRFKKAIHHESIRQFDETVVNALKLLYDNHSNKSQKKTPAIKPENNEHFNNISKSLEAVIQRLQIQRLQINNGQTNTVVNHQIEIIRNAIASIEIALDSNK